MNKNAYRYSFLLLFACFGISGCFESSNSVGTDIDVVAKDLIKIVKENSVSIEKACDSYRSDITNSIEFCPLDLDQARLINRANAILLTKQKQNSSSNIQDQSLNNLIESPLYKSLLKKADATLSEAGEATEVKFNVSLNDLTQLADEAQKIITRQLNEIAKNVVLATAEQSLIREIDVVAKLKILHQDIKNILPKDLHIPENVFGLLKPPEIIEELLTNLKTHKHRIEEKVFISEDPHFKFMLSEINNKIKGLEKLKISPEYKAFVENSSEIYSKIPKKLWDEGTINREQRVAEEKTRLIKLMEEQTSLTEIKTISEAIRGPPIKKMVLTSISEYDIDPSSWVRNEAKLRALSDELYGKSGIPENYSTPESNPFLRIAATLDDSSLTQLILDVKYFNKDTISKLPSDYLFPEKQKHLSEWHDAFLKEMARRETASKRLLGKMGNVFSFYNNQDKTVQDLLKRYTNLTQISTSERSKAYFLNMVNYRFPQGYEIPNALRGEVTDILAQSVKLYTDKTLDAVIKYADISKKITLSTENVSPELSRKHKESKKYIFAASQALAETISNAKFHNVDVAESEKKALLINSLMPRGPPYWEPPSFPSAPSSPNKPSSGGSGGALVLNQLDYQRINNNSPKYDCFLCNKNLIKIQAFLDLANSELADNEKLANELDDSPIKYAKEKGRIVAAKNMLEGKTVDWRVLAANSINEPRLQTDWDGRLQKDGEPFSYDKVKNPTTFEALGGGIHLGEEAKNISKIDLSSATLIYEKNKGLFIRDGKSGHEWIIDNTINPTSLKALYRFAVSGRNAAISIGWGNQRSDFLEQLKTRNEQQVLIDPYLVDTTVGQDLILADSIPWKLDSFKAINTIIPGFSKQFGSLKNSYAIEDIKRLTNFVNNKTISEDILSNKKYWQKQLKDSGVNLLMTSIFLNDNFADAKSWYVSQVIYEELTRNGVDISNSDDALSELQSLMHQKISAEEADVEIKKMTDEISEPFSEFGKFPNIKILRNIILLNQFQASATEKHEPNRPIIELWCAWEKMNHQSTENIVNSLLSIINLTTLAMLYDDKVYFILDKNKVVFKSSLKYRYATSFLKISDNYIGVGTESESSINEVKPLSDLTNFVNGHVTKLINYFPALQKVQRYAEIAAFFRWAEKENKEKRLGLIDMGELGNYPANDRKKYPTIDALK